MTLFFDHAIILVNDLHAGIAHYKAQGFNPFFGGVHAGGKTHNALIVFPDGTYLELLAPTSPDLLNNLNPADRTTFLFLMAQGEGLGGYALFSDDLAADVSAMQQRGLAITLNPSNGRARPDGQQLRWRTAIRANGSMTPFFLQDETPRALRVPDDSATVTQPNGIKGISGLSIALPELAAGIHEYQMMTAITAQANDSTSAQLHLGALNLTLLEQKSLTTDAKLADVQLVNKNNDSISIKHFM